MSWQEKSGRGHPPSDHQFGRGQKRARGRPKGAVGEKSIAQEIAGEVHEVRENGESKRITTYELLLKSMRNLAMSTDLRAAKWLSDYFRRKVGDPDDGARLLIVPEEMPVEQWVRQAMLRNRFATDPELKEEPIFTRPRIQNGSASD
jgi:hypothetical protein